MNLNYRAVVALALGLLVLLSLIGLAFGQGGTGRENTNAAKTAPKPKTTPRKPAKTTRSTTPSKTPTPAFRPQTPKIELVRISPGSFMMGSTNGGVDENPNHQVTINYSFYMGKDEVTQARWQAVMGDNPSYFNDCASCPVEQVSWDDTQKFIQRLNAMNDGYTYRLPTEAEWEYACRAGTTGEYAESLGEMGWSQENSGNKTHAVGGKQPNAWGLSDMHGNVWEWCQDWYHETYYGAPTDGSAWLSGGLQKYRVLRGGSWSNADTASRSAYRSFNASGYQSHLVGFRLVAVARTP